MKLRDICKDVQHVSFEGNFDCIVSSLHLDSRDVEPGGVFFAISGEKLDGHEYITEAITNGAVAIICEIMPGHIEHGVTYVQYEDTKKVVGFVASAFYGKPTEKLKVVGVTGTNGKTTTATLLATLFEKLGYKTGLISTIENRIAGKTVATEMTTPDAITLQRLFAEMVNVDCTHACMEVSSHAVEQGRIAGITFTGAVFTNITHEHLDYHGTFENYLKAKRGFFDQLAPSAFALANRDDENGLFMFQNTKAAQHYYGFLREDGSFSGELQFEGSLLSNTFHGLTLSINGHEFSTHLIGSFNAYNILAVYGAALLLGADKEKVAEVLGSLEPPKGRFEHIEVHGRVGIVDYAHTPDALENVLRTIHDIKAENQHVFTVIGCGGYRDRGKRPLMARIAWNYSDHVFLTSDNPRTEDPETILDEMEAGLDDPKENIKITREVDRKVAIKKAVEIMEDGDIVLVAGKGHENYQIIGTEKTPFDDMEILKEALGDV